MDVAYITALSALAGSVVGGLTTGITAWWNSRTQARAGLLAAESVRRQELFRDFIIASSKTYGDALVSNEANIQELVALYAMVSRMRVLCAPETVACADKVLRMTMDTYLGPNRTIRELRELMTSGAAIDPLREFSEAARDEVEKFSRP
ncbi:MAG TPA: hypothetical protein VMA86_06580 [Acetobacteraceae bacterium]|nr:hypothetical protein [Acetobacteraceae bacterium]